MRDAQWPAVVVAAVVSLLACADSDMFGERGPQPEASFGGALAVGGDSGAGSGWNAGGARDAATSSADTTVAASVATTADAATTAAASAATTAGAGGAATASASVSAGVGGSNQGDPCPDDDDECRPDDDD